MKNSAPEDVVCLDSTISGIAGLSVGESMKLFSVGDGMETDARDLGVCPSSLLFQNRGDDMLVLDDRSLILVIDTETGKVKCKGKSVKTNSFVKPIPLDTITRKEKFSGVRDSSVFDLVGVSPATIAHFSYDPRIVEPVVFSTGKGNYQTLKKKGQEFTAAATNASGDVAVGDAEGVVRLYSSCCKNAGPFTRAKTKLDMLADPVTGIDVSSDGEWVLWTTKNYLAITNTKFRVQKKGKFRSASGFKSRMGEHKNPVLILKLSERNLHQMGMTEDDVCFTSAKFDNGPILGAEGIIEEEIVTTVGPFIIRWKMREISIDWKKKRYMSSEKQQRKARIIRYDQDILANSFTCDLSKTLVSVGHESVTAVNLDRPKRSVVLGSTIFA